MVTFKGEKGSQDWEGAREEILGYWHYLDRDLDVGYVVLTLFKWHIHVLDSSKYVIFYILNF